MFKNVLVPVDLSNRDACAPAIAAAANIAKRDKADASLMTVLRLVSGSGGDDADRFERFVKDQSAEHGVRFAGAMRVGELVGRTIAAAAEEGGYDLVVMTSHDPCALDVLTGSHAASTALHAPCSVLILRGRS